MADQIWGNLASLQMLFVQLLGAVYICQPETLMPYHSRCQIKRACRYAIECRHEIGHVARRPLLRLLSWLCFYQTRSAWSIDQGSTKKRSAVHNFVPTVTKFCVMWEGLSLPHGNCRGEIVDRRMVFVWSLIHGSGWSPLIKAEPGARSCCQVDAAHLKIGYPGMKYTCTRTPNHLQQLDYKIGPPIVILVGDAMMTCILGIFAQKYSQVTFEGSRFEQLFPFPLPCRINSCIILVYDKVTDRAYGMVNAQALLLSNWISVIHGSRINWETLCCPQFRTYSYQILCHVGGTNPPTWHKIW